MEATVGRKATRYWILLAVLALHAVLLLLLAMASRYRIVLAAQHPVQIVLIQSGKRDEKRIISPLSLKPDTQIPLLRSEPPSTILLPSTLDNSQGNNVDWEGEAQRAARSSASAAKLAPNLHSNSLPSENSNWFPAPKYHKGDQIPTSNGDTMIFINDHCYQLAPAIPIVSTAGNNGMGLQTYCIAGSKEPRGDLFKDLAAYKKLHPDK